MKKNQEQSKPVIELTEEQIKSNGRTRKLAENVFKAIEETAGEVEGEFTTFEMVDVFTRIIHQYNSQALKEQYKMNQS